MSREEQKAAGERDDEQRAQNVPASSNDGDKTGRGRAQKDRNNQQQSNKRRKKKKKKKKSNQSPRKEKKSQPDRQQRFKRNQNRLRRRRSPFPPRKRPASHIHTAQTDPAKADGDARPSRAREEPRLGVHDARLKGPSITRLESHHPPGPCVPPIPAIGPLRRGSTARAAHNRPFRPPPAATRNAPASFPASFSRGAIARGSRSSAASAPPCPRRSPPPHRTPVSPLRVGCSPARDRRGGRKNRARQRQPARRHQPLYRSRGTRRSGRDRSRRARSPLRPAPPCEKKGAAARRAPNRGGARCATRGTPSDTRRHPQLT